MPTDLFGFQGGRRMADLDNTALRQAALAERSEELDIRAKETSLAQNEAFLQAMKSGNIHEPLDDKDVPDQLTNLGKIALKTGNVEKGKDLLTAGSNLRNAASLQKRRDAKTRMEQLQVLTNLYATVDDQASFDKANAQFALLTGAEVPYAGLKFSPEMIAQVRAATVSAKDQAALDLSKTRRELVQEQTEESRNRQNLIEAQIEATNARAAALRKNGNKPVPQNYVTAVSNRLQEEFEDIGDNQGQLKALSLPLAEKVYDKVQTEGLRLSEAVEAVVAEAVEDGELGGFSPQRAYTAGSHPDRPLDIPVDKKTGVVDQSKMKKNKFYLLPDGRTALYTKAGKLIEVNPEEEEEDPEVDDEELDEEEE